jgi:hypothetical protein
MAWQGIQEISGLDDAVEARRGGLGIRVRGGDFPGPGNDYGRAQVAESAEATSNGWIDGCMDSGIGLEYRCLMFLQMPATLPS